MQERHGRALQQPRLGGRSVLCAVLETGWDSTPLISVYSAHFEGFSGPSGRFAQMQEIVNDALAIKAKYNRANVPVIIAGDFNTLSTGLARLLPRFNDSCCRCCFWCYCKSEAERWEGELLPRLSLNLYDPFPKGRAGATFFHSMVCFAAKLDWILVENSLNVVAWSQGGRGITRHDWLCVDVSNRR
jgi:hypothetical protein